MQTISLHDASRVGGGMEEAYLAMLGGIGGFLGHTTGSMMQGKCDWGALPAAAVGAGLAFATARFSPHGPAYTPPVAAAFVGTIYGLMTTLDELRLGNIAVELPRLSYAKNQ
ncbi:MULTISPECIES: hypothetical protein [unclassified Bordetella]|uniref:hypothetical protein n=1 Tax=unclassified Bordetella TaxID=2630031 RepID=UPI001322CD4B|nr:MULTISPECIES: hypothetical protein [unclassified Bordetella]MVW70160.1 hypothetical protein [Bordetella sp. 15P40C-2]MVW77340.1 hypothetical protein [Bordetella sp. 02P26C-1]